MSAFAAIPRDEAKQAELAEIRAARWAKMQAAEEARKRAEWAAERQAQMDAEDAALRAKNSRAVQAARRKEEAAAKLAAAREADAWRAKKARRAAARERLAKARQAAHDVAQFGADALIFAKNEQNFGGSDEAEKQEKTMPFPTVQTQNYGGQTATTALAGESQRLAKSEVRSYVERWERIIAQRADVNSELAALREEIKGAGYEVKGINAIVKLRANEEKVKAEYQTAEVYANAMGIDLFAEPRLPEEAEEIDPHASANDALGSFS